MNKVSVELIEKYRKLDTSSITDAMDKLGVEGALLGIQAVQPNSRICGTAFTVHYIPCGVVKGTVGDFLDDVPIGQVVVIENGGRMDCTVWGDIMSQVAKDRKVEGTLIDGVCRDLRTVFEISYPIFSKGHYMRTGKDRVQVDALNVPVNISGIQVCPGDLIIGDENGAIAIPADIAEKVYEMAVQIEQTEQKIVAAVKGGMSLKEARKATGYHHLQTKE